MSRTANFIHTESTETTEDAEAFMEGLVAEVI